MADRKEPEKDRASDPYTDRRSGEDRRRVHDSNYFATEGNERRGRKDRRQKKERRGDCIPTGDWTSVCPDDDKR